MEYRGGLLKPSKLEGNSDTASFYLVFHLKKKKKKQIYLFSDQLVSTVVRLSTGASLIPMAPMSATAFKKNNAERNLRNASSSRKPSAVLSFTGNSSSQFTLEIKAEL